MLIRFAPEDIQLFRSASHNGAAADLFKGPVNPINSASARGGEARACLFRCTPRTSLVMDCCRCGDVRVVKTENLFALLDLADKIVDTYKCTYGKPVKSYVAPRN